MPLSLLETFSLGRDPADFLNQHWQQRPLLIRQAWPELTPPIDANELAGLACEPLAESRLVFGSPKQNDWRVEYGPFNEERFANLPEADFSLLVQDVDKWDDDLARLLEAFRFIPSWRIDDIMVSYATPGGSVGPHVDHYDVFLLQAQGQRRWLIDQSGTADLSTRDAGGLKLLSSFTPTDEWIVCPGDMLYLPPGVPHHGVAVTECLTYSIGMRAPSASELLLDFAESQAASLSEGQRYTDPAEPELAPGEITQEAADLAQQLLADAEHSADRQLWFADYMSRYRQVHAIAKPDSIPDLKELLAALGSGHTLRRNPWARFTFVAQASGTAALFVAGERFDTTAELAKMTCTHRQWTSADVASIMATESGQKLLRDLLAGGYWRLDQSWSDPC